MIKCVGNRLLAGFAGGVFTLLIAATALASESLPPEALEQRLGSIGLEVEALQSAPFPGWYQVSTAQGLLYVSADGQHMLTGHVYQLEGDDSLEVTNLTEQANAKRRVAAIDRLADEMIRYPADNEDYVITVFTDHTCGYCRTMHNNLAQFHEQGISVQYLAFPRAGRGSNGATQLQAIWCADNPNQALDAAKANRSPPPYTGSDDSKGQCEVDVERHLQIGRQLGVSGTPAMILPDGRLLSGYRAAPFVLDEIESR